MGRPGLSSRFSVTAHRLPIAPMSPCQAACPPRPWSAVGWALGVAAVGVAAVLWSPRAQAEGVLVGTVTRVHDGDTVSLTQGQHTVVVRLSAVDAPELSQAHGQDARRALHACAFGRQAVLNVHATDRHGRTVGQLDAGGQDCGLVLLRAGLAWHAKAYAKALPQADQLAYDAAEQSARRRRLGLWSDPAPVPPWTHRATQRHRDDR